MTKEREGTAGRQSTSKPQGKCGLWDAIRDGRSTAAAVRGIERTHGRRALICLLAFPDGDEQGGPREALHELMTRPADGKREVEDAAAALRAAPAESAIETAGVLADRGVNNRRTARCILQLLFGRRDRDVDWIAVEHRRAAGALLRHALGNRTAPTLRYPESNVWSRLRRFGGAERCRAPACYILRRQYGPDIPKRWTRIAAAVSLTGSVGERDMEGARRIVRRNDLTPRQVQRIADAHGGKFWMLEGEAFGKAPSCAVGDKRAEQWAAAILKDPETGFRRTLDAIRARR